jgi:hypothetical protein
VQIPFLDRIKRAYNAFRDRDPTNLVPYNLGPGSGVRPDRTRYRMGLERNFVSSIYTRIGIDVASMDIRHVRVDQNDRYLETINSSLNNCLSLDPNIDQTGRSFMQDVVMSMFDEGAVAIVPVDTTSNPDDSNTWDIVTMRVGRVIQWHPYHVLVSLYNEQTGIKEDITLAKRSIAIVENPLYAVMNQPNSTLKRLVNKLNLLDVIDDQSGSGKLDLIVQLPYTIKTETRRQQAEVRRKDIEDQLSGSKYGIAYIDGTEHVTQLNRPIVNNLMEQITFLTTMLHGQLGLTDSIFDGTADEKTINNYYDRTVKPVLKAITDEMKRKFLTKTARTQGQSIMYFRNPFGLLTAAELGTVGDSLTKSAILTPNDFRQVIGYKPSDDPEADKLINRNINPSGDKVPGNVPPVNAEVNKLNP